MVNAPFITDIMTVLMKERALIGMTNRSNDLHDGITEIVYELEFAIQLLYLESQCSWNSEFEISEPIDIFQISMDASRGEGQGMGDTRRG